MPKILDVLLATGSTETERYNLTMTKYKYEVYDKNNNLLKSWYQCWASYMELEDYLLTE